MLGWLLRHECARISWYRIGCVRIGGGGWMRGCGIEMKQCKSCSEDMKFITVIFERIAVFLEVYCEQNIIL